MSNKEPLLEWESFPLIENTLRSILLVMVLVVIISILWIITIKIWEMPLLYLLGLLFLILPLLPYFIPTRYILCEYTITVIYLFIKIERRYSDFGCHYADKKGVMLGTFKMPRWLDGYRGQSLRFSKDKKEKDRLLRIIEDKIGNRY